MSHDGLIDRARRLVARTAPLPEHLAGVDLMAVGGTPSALLWQREGLGLAGRGRALRDPARQGPGRPRGGRPGPGGPAGHQGRG